MSKRGQGVSRPEYLVWHSMRFRCNDPRAGSYKYYGGRGIKVCERWEKSFANFFSDMGARPSNEHSIDRIDSNGNYEPSNCRWATLAVQAKNTSRCRKITFQGETLIMGDWASRFGINRHTLQYRLNQGWPLQKAFTPVGIRPVRPKSDAKWQYWWLEVNRIGQMLGWKKEALASMDVKAWRDGYFDEGYSPAQSWREEYEAAQ